MLENAIACIPDLHTITMLLGGGTNADHYKALKTIHKTSKDWWNSLNWDEKIEVGSVLIHFRLMSANSRYYDTCEYDALKKNQKKKVNHVFHRKNDTWCVFDIAGLMGLQKV